MAEERDIHWIRRTLNGILENRVAKHFGQKSAIGMTGWEEYGDHANHFKSIIDGRFDASPIVGDNKMKLLDYSVRVVFITSLDEAKRIINETFPNDPPV